MESKTTHQREDDFEVAATLIENGDRSPLLEFIGATACLQACESLATTCLDIARAYLERAKLVFGRRTNWFAGPVKGHFGLNRAVLFVDPRPDIADSPVLRFPY